MNEEQIQQMQHEHAHRGEVIKELSHLNGELQAELVSSNIQLKSLREYLSELEGQQPDK